LSGVAVRVLGAKPQEVGLSEWDCDLIECYGRRNRQVASEFGLDAIPIRWRSSRPSRCSTHMPRAGCRSPIRT